MTLGSLWRAQGDYAKAAEAFEKAVKLEPKDATAHANLGADLPAPQADRRRHRQLEAALALKPDDYEALVSLGAAYRQKGDYQGDQAPPEGHDLEARRRHRVEEPGRRQVEHRRQGGAIVAFKKALAIEPDDGDYTSAWRPSTAASARPTLAIADYEVALEKNPRLAGAITTWASCTPRRSAREALAAFQNYLKYGASEDAASRKDAEERLKSLESRRSAAKKK